MSRAVWRLGVALVCAIAMASCAPDAAWHASADIPSPWMPADVVSLPIDVEKAGEAGSSHVVVERTYRLVVAVRHTLAYPYRDLPFTLAVRYVDSRGETFTVREIPLSIPLTDADGNPDGASWGDLIMKEVDTGQTLTFSYPGRYDLVLLQPTEGPVLAGVVSLTLILKP